MAQGDQTANDEVLTYITDDVEMEAVFLFDDGVRCHITNHHRRLCGLLTDNKNFKETDVIPITNFPSPVFGAICQITKLMREKYPAVYLAALNRTTVHTVDYSELVPFINSLSCDLRIHAANFSAYLGMDLITKVFTWYYAHMTKKVENQGIDALTNLFGCTPLTKEEVIRQKLEHEDALWRAFPDDYLRIFGHPYRST